MDSKTEKAVANAHTAIDTLVEALRLDAEQHDFRIASLIHEVMELRRENAQLREELKAVREADEADKAVKAEKKAKKKALAAVADAVLPKDDAPPTS